MVGGLCQCDHSYADFSNPASHFHSTDTKCHTLPHDNTHTNRLFDSSIAAYLSGGFDLS